ncbi:MAG: HNH endonuclease [Candidatus Sericytochromatia bacterium]|nr:HNH endonuclease [Candidatus Sericytochromatia bacterium]
MIPKRNILKQELVSLLEEEFEISPHKAYEKLALRLKISSDDLLLQRSGTSLFKHEIRWAKQELVNENIIEKPAVFGKGVWRLVSQTFVQNSPENYADDLPEKFLFSEGAGKRILVNRYERDKKARSKCLEYYGFKCSVCEKTLEEQYGEIAKGCIHVHHLVPLSRIGKQYAVDPISDLRPICPNCHYMLHRKDPPLSIEELQNIIRKNVESTQNFKANKSRTC